MVPWGSIFFALQSETRDFSSPTLLRTSGPLPTSRAKQWEDRRTQQQKSNGHLPIWATAPLIKKEGFGPCKLLCHCSHWFTLGLGHERMERDFKNTQKNLFDHLSSRSLTRSREFVLEFSMFALMPSFSFQAMPCLSWGMLQGENGTLIINLMILWTLVFFLNLPAIIYFSVSSNSCSMNLAMFHTALNGRYRIECVYSILPSWN